MSFRIIVFSFLLLLLNGCKKSNDVVNQVPSLVTSSTTSLSSTSLQSGGEVSKDGGSPVTARGVCWGTTANPTVSGSKTVDGTGTGAFTSTITGLLPNTTYYIRSYATNAVGTAYGNQVTTTTASPTVYVVGAEEIATPTIYSLAKLWTNGQGSSLSSSPNYAEAYSVFTSGSDVYVAGYEYQGSQGTGNNVAKLWKNGVVTNITNGTRDAQLASVFVSGSDVYTAGYEANGNYDAAKLWKNGVATTLAGGTNTDAYGYGVAVSGNDVYAVIQEYQSVNDVVKIWKNGTVTTLSSPNTDAYAYSIAVSGSVPHC